MGTIIFLYMFTGIFILIFGDISTTNSTEEMIAGISVIYVVIVPMCKKIPLINSCFYKTVHYEDDRHVIERGVQAFISGFIFDFNGIREAAMDKSYNEIKRTLLNHLLSFSALILIGYSVYNNTVLNALQEALNIVMWLPNTIL